MSREHSARLTEVEVGDTAVWHEPTVVGGAELGGASQQGGAIGGAPGGVLAGKPHALKHATSVATKSAPTSPVPNVSRRAVSASVIAERARSTTVGEVLRRRYTITKSRVRSFRLLPADRKHLLQRIDRRPASHMLTGLIDECEQDKLVFALHRYAKPEEHDRMIAGGLQAAMESLSGRDKSGKDPDRAVSQLESLMQGEEAEHGRRVFVQRDPETWTLRNLLSLEMWGLVELESFCDSVEYKSPLSMPVHVVPMDENTTFPGQKRELSRVLFLSDKSELLDTAKGATVLLSLKRELFDRRTKLNERAQLMEIEGVIIQVEEAKRAVVDAEAELERLVELNVSAERLDRGREEVERARQRLDRASSMRVARRSNAEFERHVAARQKPTYSLRCSPVSAVTLNDRTKEDAKIPRDAAFFCYCYPLLRLPSAGWAFFGPEDVDGALGVKLRVRRDARTDGESYKIELTLNGSATIPGHTNNQETDEAELQLRWQPKLAGTSWIGKLPCEEGRRSTLGDADEPVHWLVGTVCAVEPFCGGVVKVLGDDGHTYELPNPASVEPWNPRDPFVSLVTSGAFVFFDYQYEVVGVNALRFTPVAEDAPSQAPRLSRQERRSSRQKSFTSAPSFSAHSGRSCRSARRLSAASALVPEFLRLGASRSQRSEKDVEQAHTAILHYGKQQELPKSALRALEEANRWEPVTIPQMRLGGYSHYAWVTPSEFLGDSIYPKDGGFAFRSEAGQHAFYPIVGSDEQKGEAVDDRLLSKLKPLKYEPLLQVALTPPSPCACGASEAAQPGQSKFTLDDASVGKMVLDRPERAASGVENVLGYASVESLLKRAIALKRELGQTTELRPPSKWLDQWEGAVAQLQGTAGGADRRQVFESFDLDRNGTLDAVELEHGLKKIGASIGFDLPSAHEEARSSGDAASGAAPPLHRMQGIVQRLIHDRSAVERLGVAYTFEDFEHCMRRLALFNLDARSSLRAIHLEVVQAVDQKVAHSSSARAEEARARRRADGIDTGHFVQGLCIHAAGRLNVDAESVRASQTAGSFDANDYRTWTVANLEALDEATLVDLEYRESVGRDKENVASVLYEPAIECKERSNDGTNSLVARDTGREGWTLVDFFLLPQARRCQLSIEEVAALRLYTTSTFALINNPLRAGCDERAPHPLALTTYYLHSGLKKLRALNFGQTAFRPFYLWRGLKDLRELDEFMEKGGAEKGVMSTSRDFETAANYASASKSCRLFFRIKVSSPMDMGADVRWLSAYPTEREVIYPPLSFMRPIFKQNLMTKEGHKDPNSEAITMTVTFPS